MTVEEALLVLADGTVFEPATLAGFLAEHPIPQGTTVVSQHLERMWVTVALAERVSGELGAALG